MVLDDENIWDGILASTMFALRATIHTTTQYTPARLLICGHILIINQHPDIDWGIKKKTLSIKTKNVKIVIE